MIAMPPSTPMAPIGTPPAGQTPADDPAVAAAFGAVMAVLALPAAAPTPAVMPAPVGPTPAPQSVTPVPVVIVDGAAGGDVPVMASDDDANEDDTTGDDTTDPATAVAGDVAPAMIVFTSIVAAPVVPLPVVASPVTTTETHASTAGPSVVAGDASGRAPSTARPMVTPRVSLPRSTAAFAAEGTDVAVRVRGDGAGHQAPAFLDSISRSFAPQATGASVAMETETPSPSAIDPRTVVPAGAAGLVEAPTPPFPVSAPSAAVDRVGDGLMSRGQAVSAAQLVPYGAPVSLAGAATAAIGLSAPGAPMSVAVDSRGAAGMEGEAPDVPMSPSLADSSVLSGIGAPAINQSSAITVASSGAISPAVGGGAAASDTPEAATAIVGTPRVDAAGTAAVSPVAMPDRAAPGVVAPLAFGAAMGFGQPAMVAAAPPVAALPTIAVDKAGDTTAVTGLDLDAVFPLAGHAPLTVSFPRAPHPAAAVAIDGATPVAEPAPADLFVDPAGQDEGQSLLPAGLASAPAAVPAAPGGDVTTAAATAAPAGVGIQHHLDVAHDGAWLDRLAHDIAASADRDQKMRFQLNPERLGALHVEIAGGTDGASVRFTADSEAARALIADAQPRLVAEARAQGMKIADTQVDLSGRNAGAGGGHGNGQGGANPFAQGQQQQGGGQRAPLFDRSATARSTTRAAAVTARAERYA